MPIQENVGVLLTYGAESAFGTPATGAGASQRLQRVTSTLTLQKDGFASNVVRPDQQMQDFRHGGVRVEGGIEGELATIHWDDWIAAAMRNTWGAAQTAYTQPTGTNVSATGSTFTFGAGSLLTAGFKVGDIVRFTTLPGGGAVNNNVNFRITGLTATTMTVHPAPTAFTVQTTFSVARVGRKIEMGLLTPSYTIEQNYPTLDVSERFEGCRIGGVNYRLQPNGPVGVSWQVMGQKMTSLSGASAPHFTNATDLSTSGRVLTGIDGGLRLGGVEQAIVTGVDIQHSVNLSMTPVIGTPFVPDIFYGRHIVTGTVTYYLDDQALLNAFLNETEIDLTVVCLDDAPAPKGFIAFNMQRIKLNGASKQIGADGGIMVTSPFQALLRSGGAGTAFDQSTMTIQRSNA